MFRRSCWLALAFAAGFACEVSGGKGTHTGSISECIQVEPGETCNDVCGRCRSCELGAYQALIFASEEECEIDSISVDEYTGGCSGVLPQLHEEQWVRCCCDQDVVG